MKSWQICQICQMGTIFRRIPNNNAKMKLKILRHPRPLIKSPILACADLIYFITDTISQLLEIGVSESSYILLWTYVVASISVTLWTAFYMWLLT